MDNVCVSGDSGHSVYVNYWSMGLGNVRLVLYYRVGLLHILHKESTSLTFFDMLKQMTPIIPHLLAAPSHISVFKKNDGVLHKEVIKPKMREPNQKVQKCKNENKLCSLHSA